MHVPLASLASCVALTLTLTACSAASPASPDANSQPADTSTTTPVPQRLEDALRAQLNRARASHGINPGTQP